MKRTVLLAVAALSWTAPLAAAGAEHVTGPARAWQVASENAEGLRSKAGNAPAAVPEPSSLLIFATATLLARAVVKRRGAGIL